MNVKEGARTVIVDENNLIALISVRNGEYYKIPGGGVEEGETPIQAAIREAKEESGCDVEIIEEIGESQFIDNDKNTSHHSICFLARKIGDKIDPNFDQWEKSNKMHSFWVTFPEAIDLFSKVNTDDFFGSKINQRDFNFVLKARDILK